MNRPLSLKLFLIIVAVDIASAFISSQVPRQIPIEATLASRLIVLVGYVFLFILTWRGNRVAYVIFWIFEFIALFEDFFPPLDVWTLFWTVIGVIEMLLLALSWRYFFRRNK